MLADAELSLFTKVVVSKLDRLARKLKLLLDLKGRLKDANVALLSVKEIIDISTSTGRLVFQVLGLVGEWERGISFNTGTSNPDSWIITWETGMVEC